MLLQTYRMLNVFKIRASIMEVELLGSWNVFSTKKSHDNLIKTACPKKVCMQHYKTETLATLCLTHFFKFYERFNTNLIFKLISIIVHNKVALKPLKILEIKFLVIDLLINSGLLYNCIQNLAFLIK